MVAKNSDEKVQPLEVTRCKGFNGTVIFDGTWVTIHRTKGLQARMAGKGEKKIALSQMTSVRWKRRKMMRGFISFTVPGNEARSTQDVVLVTPSQTEEFLALKAKIEDALAQHHAPSPPSAVAATDDPAEQLKKLADLHQSGLLTDEDFAAKRAALVDKLWADT